MTIQFRNVHYTTLDRQDTFTFDFVQISNREWRAYIVDQPPYGNRPQGAHDSHRLHDARGQYVCWDPAPRSLDEAKGAARAWADATQVYIRTGRFPPPGGPRYVPDLSTSADWAYRTHTGTIPVPAPPAPAAGAPPARPSMHATTTPPTGLRGIFARRRTR